MSARQLVLKTALSIGVSVIALAVLMRLTVSGDGGLQPGLLEVLLKTAPVFVGFYVFTSLFQAFFRAVRYRVLIRAANEAQVPSLFHTLLVTLTRNMLVDLFPARVGELSYIAMMNRSYQVSGRACVSSLTISFVFDLVALLALLLGLVVYYVCRAQVAGWLLYSLVGLTVLVAIMLVLVFVGLHLCVRLARWCLARMPHPGVLDKIVDFLAETADAIDFTRRAGVMPRVMGLSLLVRSGKYAGLVALFYAVSRTAFPDLTGASLLDVLLAIFSAEASASLPVPTFMSFGTYEAGGLLALTLLGFAAAASRLAMLAMHIWSQCIDYALGCLALITYIFHSGARIPGTPARLSRRNLVLALLAGALVVAGVGLLGLQLRKIKKQGALRAPAQGISVSAAEPEQAQLSTVCGALKGFMVWSSNRHGSHDILMMSFPGGTITPLTTHPHVETFPRISPDGQSVVFCRSQQTWVSQRNPVPWDVYRLNLADGKDVLVARNGNTPTWSEDGTRIFFQRGRGRVVEHVLADGSERILFEAGRDSVPAGVDLQTPSFSTAQKALAVTFRGARRTTARVPLNGAPDEIARGGCQLTWSPAGDFLYYVDHGGRQKNAIHRRDTAATTGHQWLDLTGSHSHEYFPRVSNDGTCLVLGASASGHEHDVADYEIFLWRIGDPADAAVRLTFHTGNDCWPDLFLR